ncbi:hypothetical protein K2P47_01670 [Patescibacteria group bacterium]|nr:hypothetical protein [Patescibacteria group bacterium]
MVERILWSEATMKSSTSGYVQLKIRGRRFVGTWVALSNIVIHTTILQDTNAGFSIPVNHILRDGVPNKFPVIKFKRKRTFHIVDTTLATPSKPIRLYEINEADDTNMSADHFELLLRALVEHGRCMERKECFHQPNFSRIR